MTLKDIFLKEFDLRFDKMEKFDLFDLDKYFSKDENYYKHTLGVAGQIQSLLKQSDFNEEEKTELMLVAYMHNIGYSRRVKKRGLNALDSAIFAIEKGFSDEIALAIMFNCMAIGEAHLIGGFVSKVYNKAKVVLNSKVKKYIDFITFANMHTEIDGTPTKLNRRIFKILARNKKGSVIYKNTKANKKEFKKIKNRVLNGFVKEKSMFQEIIDVLLDRK